MGENSAIAWCTDTFNPWVGCVKVSPGCDHCYAEAYDQRFRDGESWGAEGKRTMTKMWNKPQQWNAAAAKAGARRRVFCASLADVFEDNARRPLDDMRAELFRLIVRTPSLDWLLLTKRPGNIMRHVKKAFDLLCVRDDVARGRSAHRIARSEARVTLEACTMLREWLAGNAPANVWVGCTVEDQKHAALRIPQLLRVPARVRFLSCEPLLERVDLDRHGLLWRDCSRCRGRMSLPVEGGGRACPNCLDHQGVENAGIDWVIIGGESSQPNHPARPFSVEWARSLVRQALWIGCAPFVKQLGSRPEGLTLVHRAGADPSEWPVDLRVQKFPVPR